MKVFAVKTRAMLPPKDDLLSLIKESFLDNKIKLKEESIIVITSKIVAIGQGRCVKINRNLNKEDQRKEKDKLIKLEADFYIDRKHVPKQLVTLTIKNNILIPTSGIDESNANGYYVLWPKNPFKEAKKIHEFIKKEFGIKKFGIIISDSHTTPLRAGISGISIAYYGFYPLRDYRGKKDIFGRELTMSQTNVVDSLADIAVFAMGEGNEQTPIAIVEDAKGIKFGFDSMKNDPLIIDKKEDIYWPVINGAKWSKGKGTK
jgi:F420-0:gamma-glutamyl ligase